MSPELTRALEKAAYALRRTDEETSGLLFSDLLDEMARAAVIAFLEEISDLPQAALIKMHDDIEKEIGKRFDQPIIDMAWKGCRNTLLADLRAGMEKTG